MSAARRAALALAGLALALAPARPAAAEDAAEAAAGRAEVGVARLAAEDAAPRGPSVDERLARIRARIQAALVYPPLARLRRQEGETRVRFEIAADGRPTALAVEASAGSALLDRAALAAVEAAAPLPWVYGRLEVPVRFELGTRR